MPKAGIHARRSTNWKSAEVASKRLHSSSVSANTRTDTTSATFRASVECGSSSFRKARTIAPAIGRAMSEVRIGNVMAARSRSSPAGGLPPQEIPQDEHGSDEHRCRVRDDRARLDTTHQLTQAADGGRHAVHGAVDEAD